MSHYHTLCPVIFTAETGNVSLIYGGVDLMVSTLKQVSLCLGSQLPVLCICPWDGCFGQGHSMCLCVSVCVLGHNVCCLSLPWQGKGDVENWSAMPFSFVPTVSCAQNVHVDATLC